MNIKSSKRFRGTSLLEILIAAIILMVAVIGTAQYRYYWASDIRKGDMQTEAAGIGYLLCESWRGVKGAVDFDPITYLGSDLQIVKVYEPLEILGKDVDTEVFNLLCYCRITSNNNNTNYYAAMFYRDVSTQVRALNVVVGRASDGKGATTADELSKLKLFKLTTYTGI
ncbi:MAG: type IV pilus modification PilV family protein [Planctomycetota bacterium]|jgi:hypothetical protein